MIYKLSKLLTKYTIKNDNNYEPVAVGRYGIRKRSDIYKKELSDDYLRNKVIFQNTLIIGMGSVQIDVGVLSDDVYYSVSPAYHTFKINTNIVLSEFMEILFTAKNYIYTQRYMIASARQGKKVDLKGLLNESVDIPTFDEQHRIIDKVKRIKRIILDLKKQSELLNELEKSVFFELFGNKKPNKTFEQCVEKMTKGPFGSAVKKSLFVPESPDAYKVYIQVNAIQQDETLGNYFISKQYFESKMKSFEVKANDYLITCDGTLGKYVRLSDNPRKGIISASLLRIHLNESVICPKYFEAFWDNVLLERLKTQTRNGCLIHLPSAKVIGKESIYLPDMNLQKSFSDFVKKNESLKLNYFERISSLNELLNMKMDEFFGGNY